MTLCSVGWLGTMPFQASNERRQVGRTVIARRPRRKFYLLVSESEAANFRTYQYWSTDASVVYPYLKPVFQRVAAMLPEKMSPNWMTIIGAGFNLSLYLLVYWHASNALCFQTFPGAWVYLACAALFGLGYVCDAMDGLQGRRTGQYSEVSETKHTY